MNTRALIFAATLLTVAGCGSQADATSPTRTAAPTAQVTIPSAVGVGQAAPFTGPTAAGTVVINSARRTNAPADDPYRPKDGTYLILDVTVTASQGTVPTDESEFAAKGSSGYSYGAEMDAGQPLSGSARPGLPSRGNVIIDAPAGDGPYRIQWQFGLDAQPLEFSING